MKNSTVSAVNEQSALSLSGTTQAGKQCLAVGLLTFCL